MTAPLLTEVINENVSATGSSWVRCVVLLVSSTCASAPRRVQFTYSTSQYMYRTHVKSQYGRALPLLLQSYVLAIIPQVPCSLSRPPFRCTGGPVLPLSRAPDSRHREQNDHPLRGRGTSASPPPRPRGSSSPGVCVRSTDRSGGSGARRGSERSRRCSSRVWPPDVVAQAPGSSVAPDSGCESPRRCTRLRAT